jgi:hypothetical protein
MKTGDQIWIFRNNKITTSTISKIGSKWGYFKQQEKFCLKAMRVIGSCGQDGTVFLSEEALNEHIQKDMSEAPKTIYLSNDIPRLLFFEGEVGFVEYIRKDEAQARIKELEEALEKIKSFCLRGRSVVSAFEIARNALDKEST